MRDAAIVLQQYIRGQRSIRLERFSLYDGDGTALKLTCFCNIFRKTVTAEALKQGWAAVVIQRHWRGYIMRQIYQAVCRATITIQAFTRGWMARKQYKKVWNMFLQTQISCFRVLMLALFR